MEKNKNAHASDLKKTLKKLDGSGLTDFQKDVLYATSKIRKGEVKTYKQVAAMSGHPNAFRAVDTALKKNPFPIIIPCHRVIKSNGGLGNYSGGGKKESANSLKRKELP